MTPNTLLARRLAIELPRRMRTLPRDRRGYPIPFIVLIDRNGEPQFTINDWRRVAECRTKHLCSICGKRFDKHPVSSKYEMWFVGGSRCFLHPRGGFLDPPMHLDCATYALRVCPFLAARAYSGRIDDAKLTPGGLPSGTALVREEYMQPALPERFGLGLTFDYRFHQEPNSAGVYTVDDWHYVEWWKAGEAVDAPASGEPPPDPRETA
jgi:hypothetical protein